MCVWHIVVHQGRQRRRCEARVPNDDVVNDLCNEMERSNYLFCLVLGPLHNARHSSYPLISRQFMTQNSIFMFFIMYFYIVDDGNADQTERGDEMQKGECVRWVHYPSACIIIYVGISSLFVYFFLSIYVFSLCRAFLAFYHSRSCTRFFVVISAVVVCCVMRGMCQEKAKENNCVCLVTVGN